MSWLGIATNEWLFAGFLIVLVLGVPRLGDLGQWVAEKTAKRPTPGAPASTKPGADDAAPRDDEREDG